MYIVCDSRLELGVLLVWVQGALKSHDDVRWLQFYFTLN